MKVSACCLRALVAVALAVAGSSAFAGVTLFSDRGTFSSLGIISENYGFEDIANARGLLFPGDPWTAHGVTYTTGGNLIVGSNLGPASNVFINYVFGGPVTGNIGNHYNLFGFDIGNIYGPGHDNIALTTNLGTYTFSNLAVLSQPAMSFFGFSAAGGEYFKSFQITANSSTIFPALDNVTLGVTTPVPEPTTSALLLAGLLGLVALNARRRRPT